MTKNRHPGQNCGNCGFWLHLTDHTGECRLRAPAPSDYRDEVAHWAHTFHEDYCGEWRAGDHEARAMTLCKHCAYWSFLEGGLTPVDQRDQRTEWWARAGHCQRRPPEPSELPGHKAFWRATHDQDGCFDGKTVSI